MGAEAVCMSQTRLLVVEDEAIVAADLREQLEALGYTVVATADTGPGAITQARALRPNLVLMDVQLKGEMDGPAAANVIAHELEIPVVFLTAHADGASVERARDSGPFGYIVKPADRRELRTTLEIALHRHALEQRVRQAERFLAATLRSIGDAVIATDAAGRVTFMNPVAEALTGHLERDSLGRALAGIFATFDPTTGQAVEDPTVALLLAGHTSRLQRDKTLLSRQGVCRPIEDTCAPIRDEQGRVVGGILVFRDVTERTRQTAEREQLIATLQEALANVKTLSGLLPICAWCKKVRDDRGYWEKVETYVMKHSQAEFTHGICPDCRTQLEAAAGTPPGDSA
jgi:PAS domain S-box-containing protein